MMFAYCPGCEKYRAVIWHRPDAKRPCRIRTHGCEGDGTRVDKSKLVEGKKSSKVSKK